MNARTTWEREGAADEVDSGLAEGAVVAEQAAGAEDPAAEPSLRKN